MTDPERDNFSEGEPAEPQRLRRALRRASGPHLHVPPEVDEAVLAAGRQRMRSIRRRRGWRIAGGGVAAAAAAGLALTAWLTWPGGAGTGAGPGSPSVAKQQSGASAPADVDGNGRVDVLDAFALARRLEAGDRPPASRLDLTGDDRVDRDDVRAITDRAVALKGGRS
jgi:hypothetical protein